MLLAAESVGENGEGKDGLIGYLRLAAIQEMSSYLSLMGKLLPYQITGVGGGPLRIETNGMSLQDRQQQFAEDLRVMRQGHMPPRLVQMIEQKAAEMIQEKEGDDAA